MHKNSSIKCTVNDCKHNCADDSCCSLDSIVIGTHELHPSVPEGVDCKSFEKKNCCN